MDESVQTALNEQIKHELESAYIYLAMCAHFEAVNLPGFARWMRLQAQEELGHAMRLFDYIHDRGGQVELQALSKPPTDFGTPASIFERALEHEKLVTRLIEQLHEKALSEKDYATQVFLQWFITEQVEEEKSARPQLISCEWQTMLLRLCSCWMEDSVLVPLLSDGDIRNARLSVAPTATLEAIAVGARSAVQYCT